MKRQHKSLYVQGDYERYFDELMEIAKKKDKSFAELVGKAVREYTLSKAHKD